MSDCHSVQQLILYKAKRKPDSVFSTFLQQLHAFVQGSMPDAARWDPQDSQDTAGPQGVRKVKEQSMDMYKSSLDPTGITSTVFSPLKSMLALQSGMKTGRAEFYLLYQ